MKSRDGEEIDPRVNRALQEYLERIDRGEAVDPEQYLEEHAEIADALRSFLANAACLAQRAGDMVDAAEVSTSQSLSETVAPASAGGTSGLPEAFGRYRVQRLLGRGAMGAVYLAQDTQLSRRVALKIPNFGGEQSDELLQRFYREAQAAATLRHPNICPVYDVGEIDSQHFISMAFIEGHSLSDIVKANGAQPERQVLLAVRKLALALQEAHDAGIIHRDLKPANVMIDGRGEPIVMDFGLACQQREGGERLTHSGMILGSPAYISPEQLEGQSSRITPAADQYALGVMLYELLTGELPFRGSISAVISQIVTKPAPSPKLIRPELDPRVDQMCLKMLSKSADGRYPSMKAVAERIVTILKEPARPDLGLPAPPTPDSGPVGETAVPGKVNVRQKVADLVKRGDYPAALAFLEPLTRDETGKLSAWAQEQLARVKQEQQRLERDHSALQLLAAKLIRKHDYAEAIRVLSGVPVAQRTEELQDLLDDAESREEEAGLLLKDIEGAIRKEEPKDLPQLVKRFLQLKPGNKAVLQLAADLKRYGPEHVIRVRRGRRDFLDPAGQVWNPSHIALFCGGLAVLCLLVYFSVITFATPRGTVIVEVHDPRITVSFSGDEITTFTSGRRFPLKPSERRTLQLEVDGVKIDAASQEISVANNETKLVAARLVDGKPELKISGETAFPVATGARGGGVPGPGGSQAVSMSEENRTENAWIDLLSDVDPAAASRRLFQWSSEGPIVRGVLPDSADNGWMHLGLPREIRGDYDLEVEFLVEGSRYVQFGLPLDNNAVSASFGKGGSTLHSIDGQDLNGQGRIARPHGNLEARLESGKPQKVTASVRHKGENVAVETTLNGVAAGSFEGLRSRLSRPGAPPEARDHVLLVAEILDRTPGRRFEIRSARVRMLSLTSETQDAGSAGVKIRDGRVDRVVLDVDFRKNSGGFDLRDQHHIRTEWRNGEYHFFGKKQGRWFHQVHRTLFDQKNAALPNLGLELDVRLVGGKRGRFAVEFGRTGQDRLFLVLDHEGRVSLVSGTPDQYVELLIPTRPDAMHPVDQFNTLRIQATGGRLQYSVNGVQIYRFSLQDFTGVPIQPWIWADETPLDVRLQRFRLVEMDSTPTGPPAPLPLKTSRLTPAPDAEFAEVLPSRVEYDDDDGFERLRGTWRMTTISPDAESRLTPKHIGFPRS